MQPIPLKTIYGIGWAFIAMIRIPYRWRVRTNRMVVGGKTTLEQSLLTRLYGLMIVLPLAQGR